MELQQQKCITQHSNEQTLNIKTTANYSIVNVLFQLSEEESDCANKSGCVILLHSERKKVHVHVQ